MKKLSTPLLALLCLACSTQLRAQLKIPKGYSELKTSPANGGMMKQTAVHLDEDNKPDQVSVISLKGKPTEDVMLLVYFTKTKTQEIIRLNPPDEKEIFMFPLRVVNNNLEFAYGMKGTKNFARYIRIGYSKDNNKAVFTNYETYFKHDDKSALKTYNLLTGDYKINYNDLDPASNKIHRDAKFGHQKQELLAFDQYNDEFLKNLDMIMQNKENEKPIAEQIIEKPNASKQRNSKKKK